MPTVPAESLLILIPEHALPEPREVEKCHTCGLNQYVQANRHCLRCHLDLFPPKPEVVIATIESVDLNSAMPRHTASGPLNVGAATRIIRLVQSLSQRDLANIMGAPRTYVSKVENAACIPTIENVHRIAHALGMHTDLFIRVAECLGSTPRNEVLGLAPKP